MLKLQTQFTKLRNYVKRQHQTIISEKAIIITQIARVGSDRINIIKGAKFVYEPPGRPSPTRQLHITQ